jgi:multidrug efflux pump
MLGETTLAMLYVPLLFYLFDRMKEGKEDKGKEAQPAAAPPPAAHPGDD